MITPRRSGLVALLAVAAAAIAVAVVLTRPAAPPPSPSPSSPTALVTPSPTPAPVTGRPTLPPTASPSATPSALPSATPSPTPTSSPAPSPSAPGPRTATRVVVPALGIDLAVTKPPPNGAYPYCNVAMAFGKPFGQPGEPRATYLFAHARDGMFGPIYELTMVKRTPDAMTGMLVYVYTSDSVLHVYQITEVLPHQLTLRRPLGVSHDQLWLQTSEGPHGTPGKTQVVAEPRATHPASYADAHPKVRIVHCGT